MPSTAALLEERKSYIGGSEIAAAMGLSKWRSPLALWAEKTGKITPDPLANFEAKEIGTELEEYVARKFERKTGKKLRADQQEMVHPEFPFLRGHADYIVLGEDATFDSKTTSAYQLRAWEGDEIPMDYILQQNWYCGLKRLLKLKGWQSAYLGVLIGGQKFIWKQVMFNPDLFDQQEKAAVRFWNEFVLPDVAPMATANDSDILTALFPKSSGAIVNLQGPEARQLDLEIGVRENLKAELKKREEELDALESRIKQKIGTAGGFVTDRCRISWGTESRTYVDRARLEQDGLLERYSYKSETRVLRAKTIKEPK